jgi:hypothetical protein
MKLLIVQLSSDCCYFSPLSTLFSHSRNLCSSGKVRYRCSQQYKAVGKMIAYVCSWVCIDLL